jgi:hypothetical protein
MTVYATDYNVELRDRAGYLKGYLTPFIQDNLSWKWNHIGGCGQCKIKIGKKYREINFSAGDDIQIRIKSGATSKLVYRGWISNVTPALKIDENISIDCRGYFDRLKNIIIQNGGDKKTYSSVSVSDLVTAIIDTYITPNTPITKGTIDPSCFAIDTIEFKCDVAEALKTLAELEGRIEYGVDENLQFFWRAESTALRKKYLVGEKVEDFERKIDWSQLVNKIYFEGGTVNDAKYLKTVDASDSQTMYFLSEDIVSNSSIVSSSVADQYLSSLLREKSSPKLILRFKIPNTDLRLEDTLPMGEIAVYDPEYDDTTYIWGKTASGGSNLIWGKRASGGSNKIWGGLYQEQVESISYTLSSESGKFDLDITLGGSILETSAKIKQIEYLLSMVRQRS